MSRTTFIAKIKPLAILSFLEYGVLPSLTIAQAILESGDGESELAEKANNLFGMKWNSKCGYDKINMPTKEYINNQWITIDAYFRKYSSIQESINDHAKLFHLTRYKKVLAATNYSEAAKAVYEAGYATDPKYTTKLLSLILAHRLDLIDEQVKAWEYQIGLKAINSLAEKQLLNTPENWKTKDLKTEDVPLWLFFELVNRITGGEKK
jgi:flagellum-specific peptidoglycan hydrolase FlgJ